MKISSCIKTIPAVSALVLYSCTSLLAGSGYDRCIKEEKALKVREAEDCNGLRYLLNPSACFATQKSLKEYKAGKCRQIGIAESVDFSTSKVIPEKTSSSPTGTGKSERGETTGKMTETEALRQDSTREQLMEENSRLKTEIIRLTTENEQLRKTGH